MIRRGLPCNELRRIITAFDDEAAVDHALANESSCVDLRNVPILADAVAGSARFGRGRAAE